MKSPESAAEPQPAPAPRLAALDAFRGLTVLLMWLVNNVSLDTATPKHLTHADWSGRVHLADVVFPWFLLAVGVALPFAVAGQKRRGERWLSVLMKILRRTVSLVLLGILVDSTVNHAWTPGLGVLQVIGLAYFVAALLSPLHTLARAVCAAALLAAHSALILLWDVPGFGAGHITEGANAVAFLNEIYLAPWGMKGLISVVPTAAMVLIGTVLGDLFRQKGLTVARSALVCGLIGVPLLVSGYALGSVLPMSKPLWTASYILYTAGLGALLLAALRIAVDGTRQGTKLAFALIVPGSNAITAYVVPILFKINTLQGWTVMTATGRATVESALQTWCYALAGRVNGGWLYTLAYLALWWGVLYYLYRKQWFLRV